MEETTVLSGYGIVVVDRGFVYVGDVRCGPEWCIITNARNIRCWGTTRGLGQLALEGPTKEMYEALVDRAVEEYAAKKEMAVEMKNMLVKELKKKWKDLEKEIKK